MPAFCPQEVDPEQQIADALCHRAGTTGCASSITRPAFSVPGRLRSCAFVLGKTHPLCRWPTVWHARRCPSRIGATCGCIGPGPWVGCPRFAARGPTAVGKRLIRLERVSVLRSYNEVTKGSDHAGYLCAQGFQRRTVLLQSGSECWSQ